MPTEEMPPEDEMEWPEWVRGVPYKIPRSEECFHRVPIRGLIRPEDDTSTMISSLQVPKVHTERLPLPLDYSQSPNTPQTCRFLALPREIRNNIYTLCFRIEEGLTYNFETNKLTGSNEYWMSLLFTCRQISEEVTGLALIVNTITFRTFYSDKSRRRTAYFGTRQCKQYKEKCAFLTDLAGAITPDVIKKLGDRYPQFHPLLVHIQTVYENNDYSNWYYFGRSIYDWGEGQSILQDFVHEAIHLLSKSNPAKYQLVARRYAAVDWSYFFYTSHQSSLLREKNWNSKPWDLPSEGETDEEIAAARDALIFPDRYRQMYTFHNGNRYAVSAAALAIGFLKSLPTYVMQYVRHIRLLEDRESVAYPQCHARGLIPLCQLNPKMRIERIAKLWTTVLPVNNVVLSHNISITVGQWIAEAVQLPSLGMPERSFTLLFDCESLVEKSTAIFSIMLRDAAWQLAYDHFLPNQPWHERRLQKHYIFESFRSAMADISNSDCKSLIRCNFPVGEMPDYQDILSKQRTWSKEQWKKEWYRHDPLCFETDPPLPPFGELRAQYHDPQLNPILKDWYQFPKDLL